MKRGYDSSLVGPAQRQSQELIGAGRKDVPDAGMAERITSALEHKQKLARVQALPMVPAAHSGVGVLIAGLAGLSIAASAALWWRPDSKTKPTITPEATPAASTAQSAAPVRSRRVVKDPCLVREVAEGKVPLIDDFEDGDDAVLKTEGRAGLWRWVRDTDAPLSSPALLPIPRLDARASNRWAIHVKGGRLLDWGAIVEVTFNPSCYDAAAYAGLSFQAKGPGRIFVAPREVSTIPESEGGTCVDDCYNPHVHKVELDEHWRTYRLEWKQFEQRGYGRPRVDSRQLHSIAFLIRAEDTPYDVWLDDVAFLRNH